MDCGLWGVTLKWVGGMCGGKWGMCCVCVSGDYVKVWQVFIHVHMQEGHMAVIELLLQYGANPNHPNKKGCTPLWVASQVTSPLQHTHDQHTPHIMDACHMQYGMEWHRMVGMGMEWISVRTGWKGKSEIALNEAVWWACDKHDMGRNVLVMML